MYMEAIKLAIDWTPNVNHIGFFVARDIGLYEKNGITLEIHNPLDDNYRITPAKKLELDLADFAIAPFETIISLNNKIDKVDAIGVFAILQNDLSSIATLRESNINSPRDLDNTIYASYKARYEDQIVKQMIINDGGTGNIHIIYPDKLGIWNTLLEGKATATWIFDNWEGIEAETKNIQLQKFKMSDFGIPYGYSPVLLTKQTNITTKKDLYIRFLKATKEGFLYAKNNIDESISILQKYLTAYDLQHIDLIKSFKATVPHFGDEKNCGEMEEDRVISFLEWIVEQQLETKLILEQHLYTNELLE